MKKAKRLLAVLLAALMIVSAAFLPAYAKMLPGNAYVVPKVASNQKYYFEADQGAGWLLDMLDSLLADANIKLDLADLINTTLLDIITNDWFGTRAEYSLDDINYTIDLTSIDNAVRSIYIALDVIKASDLISLLSGLFGDLLNDEYGITKDGLNMSIKRGKRSENYNGGSNDMDVLYMVLNWVNNLRPMLKRIVAGEFELGSLLESVLPDDILSIVQDLDGFLKLMLYQMLVDSNAEALPTDTSTPLDDGVQKVINWALITGTSSEVGGMTSILGENAEPLMPAMGDLPGGANIKGVAIDVDRDGDGVLESKTMSFYQLVANVIDGLLNGMLAPMLGELIADLVGVEITEQYPEGDPAILQDMMFNTILGAVESLAEQNGAPDLVYTEEQNATPMGKINALMDWFFNKGGLDTFIKIDFWGIGITDNFMSLLNDIGRLAINLLPGLIGGDMFEGAESLAYTADELNLIRYYKANSAGQYVTCDETDPDAIGQTYLTYENGEVIYATEWDPDTDAPTAYKYLSNHQVVDIDEANEGTSTYRNGALIRPNYVITRDQVFACLIKMLLNGFIEGCYWPEWTDNIPAVLAYAMAALAAPVLPEGNYFARLDAFHQTGGVAPISDSNGGSVEPIPYYTIKNGIEVPTGALDIGAAVAAFYLNAVFTFEDVERLTEVDTCFEQFVAEFLIWAADEYLPMIVGNYDATAKTFTGTGIWVTAFNNLIEAIYSDYATRTVKSDANWDAIYTFLDVTLLKLIPADWLPADINTSFDLFDGWLLNNLLHFDLQGILSIISVNTDENTELHKPALTVIIRIIDRVLGLVFNGTPLLLPIDANRSGVNASTGVANIFVNHTSIDSLDALLSGNGSSDSLPTFVDQLLGCIVTYKAELLGTILPLVMGGVYTKPYDKEIGASGDEYDDDWLTANGRDLASFTAADLQWYIDMFTEHTNAVKGAVKYDTYEEAEAAITDEENQYVSGQSFYVKQYDDEGNEIYDGYYIYTNNNYYITATETAVAATKNGEDNSYSDFNNFTYSHLVDRTMDRPYILYEDYDVATEQERFATEFRAHNVEDYKQDPYAYHNLKQAIEDANETVAAYDAFSTDLGNAYAEWQRYFIQTRLYQYDLVDSNGDGIYVNSTSDSDYVAPTEDSDGNITDPGIPVDDPPTLPTSILPFDFGTNTAYPGAQFTYYDQSRDDYFTITPDTFTTANDSFRQYDQIAKAYDMGLEVKNNVVLSEAEAEEVVQVAIRSLEFDLSRDSNGNYDSTKIQWAGLSSSQLQDVATLCAELHYQFTYDVEAGFYEISRPAFRFIDSSYVVFGTSDKVINADACPPLALSDGTSSDEAVKIDDRMYTAYLDYLVAVLDNRKSIYNAIELLTDRAEEAEERRMGEIDSQMLKWALNLSEIKNAYENTESGIRNRKITGVKDDGTYYYTKVYTQSSYDEFRKAYDYARCLDLAEQGLIQSEGLTQSMVTEAFHNLLDAYKKLVLYTGDADFTQLLEYLAIAEGMINNPNATDSELGYTADSLANLESVYTAVLPVSVDKTIDCESQQIVDAAAADLLTAINNIVYNSVPKIVPAIEGVLTEITSAEGAARTQGHIFGLKEGEGITLDLIEVIGMRIDEGVGNKVTVEDSGKGTGTGAYFKGTVGNLEKFRFYAVLYGDLNGDTRIDGTDRTAVDLYVVQGTNNSAEPDDGGMGAIRFEAGDVDHSGGVDAADSALIELHYNYEDAEGNDYQIPQDEHSPVAVVA